MRRDKPGQVGSPANQGTGGLGKPPRTIVVTSGKGGVGKTTVAVNLAVSLAGFGQRVTLLDADYGLGNVDLLLGLDVRSTLNDFLRGRAELSEIAVRGPNNLNVIPASAGSPDLTHLTEEQKQRLQDGLAGLGSQSDLLVVDTASGISENVLSWLERADDVVVVTTPDRAAWVDAYAVIKLLGHVSPDRQLSLLVNNTADEAEASDIHARLAHATSQSLGGELPLLGHVVQDLLLLEATRRGEPIVTLLPTCPASICFRSLARKLLRQSDGACATVAPATPTSDLEPVGC